MRVAASQPRRWRSVSSTVFAVSCAVKVTTAQTSCAADATAIVTISKMMQLAISTRHDASRVKITLIVFIAPQEQTLLQSRNYSHIYRLWGVASGICAQKLSTKDTNRERERKRTCVLSCRRQDAICSVKCLRKKRERRQARRHSQLGTPRLHFSRKTFACPCTVDARRYASEP